MTNPSNAETLPAPSIETEWRPATELTVELVRAVIAVAGVHFPECSFEEDPESGHYALFLMRRRDTPERPSDLPFLAPITVVRSTKGTEPYLVFEEPFTGDSSALSEWVDLSKLLVRPITAEMEPVAWPTARSVDLRRRLVDVEGAQTWDVLAAILTELGFDAAAYCVRHGHRGATPSLQAEVATRAPLPLRAHLGEVLDLWDRFRTPDALVIARVSDLYARLP